MKEWEDDPLGRRERDRRMNSEWDAWGRMIDAFLALPRIPKTREELNKDDPIYKRFFMAVDAWGQETARLRIVQRDLGEFDVMREDGRIWKMRGTKE